MIEKNCTQKRRKIIQIDEIGINDHLGKIVKGSVQETLNAMLDEEADLLSNAKRYERTEGRKDTRAGSYKRALHTKTREVEMKYPETEDPVRVMQR